MIRAGLRLGVLVCTFMVALPHLEAFAETNRTQNFGSRNWFEELFDFNRQRPSHAIGRSRTGTQHYQHPQSRVVPRGAVPQRAAQPRREDNIDPDGEPTARTAPDIAVYIPAPLVALNDASLEASGIDDPVSAAILAELREGSLPAMEVSPEARAAIIDFYKSREFIPAWVGVTGLTDRAKNMLATMAKAEDEGLKAQHYRPATLRSFRDTASHLVDNPRALARLDLELTVAALTYAQHAYSGRVDPNKITRFNDLAPPTLPAGEVLAQLNSSKTPGAHLASLHPDNEGYRALKTELQRLRARQATAQAMPEIRPGAVIKLGMRDDRVPQIRIRLASLGLLENEVEISGASGEGITSDASSDPVIVGTLDVVKPDPSETGSLTRADFPTGSVTVASSDRKTAAAVARTDPSLYDLNVMNGIKAFQRREGLRPDGIVGRQTIAAFNDNTDARKIETVLLNMERVRWMPRGLGERYVLVNQPAFELTVVDKGAEVLRTRVVIGTHANQTPSFSDVMKTIEFNPYWYVPRSIATKEMLPRSKRDPGYLTRSGYEVINARGQSINSASVDWSRYTARTMPVSVRQPPGRSNALGEMKFLFPNKHAVYLHDTPSKSLFNRDTRSFSHGCVRVQNPREFAKVLLAPEGWTADRIAKAIATGRNTGVKLTHRIDVHLAYLTAWPDANGNIRYYNDIYGRDAKLAKAMSGKRVSL